MPRYPIREAPGAARQGAGGVPGSGGGWRPTWSAWSIESGCGSASRRRRRRGTAAQGEQNQERWLDLVAGATGPAEAGAEPPDRSGRRPGEARRAKTGLDDPPSEVRGLIERHEQLRGWRTRIRWRTPRTSTRGPAERHGPHVVWEIVEA